MAIPSSFEIKMAFEIAAKSLDKTSYVDIENHNYDISDKIIGEKITCVKIIFNLRYSLGSSYFVLDVRQKGHYKQLLVKNEKGIKWWVSTRNHYKIWAC